MVWIMNSLSRGISYERLLEIALLFKDGLMADDKQEALTYMKEIVQLSEKEAEILSIDLQMLEDKK